MSLRRVACGATGLLAILGLLALASRAASPDIVVCNANEDHVSVSPASGDYGAVTRQTCYHHDFNGSPVVVLFVD